MSQYLDNLNPFIREYFKVLSPDFPKFLIPYIETPRMQKQQGISVTCGTFYAKMFHQNLWYSSLDHSVGVALIIWHFTKDKKMTLAGLFHDISTPCFKHAIDYLHQDYEKQESTEELTKKFIEESKEISSLLEKDKIKIEEVCDYHIYPIADNDTPMLSSDRLEYTLSNGLGVIYPIWNLDEIRQIYDNIVVCKKENGEEELAFKDKDVALSFVRGMSKLSICYMNDNRRFGMQFLADIIRMLVEKNILCEKDLYELSEQEVIALIKNVDDDSISECFNAWQNSEKVLVSNDQIDDKYCIKVFTKRRYIDPLVIENDKPERISSFSFPAKRLMQKTLNYDFNHYLYLDFNLCPHKKIKKI